MSKQLIAARSFLSGQEEDGGWSVDFQSFSPAAALEWRGYATVRALTVLRDNGAIEAPRRSR